MACKKGKKVVLRLPFKCLKNTQVKKVKCQKLGLTKMKRLKQEM